MSNSESLGGEGVTSVSGAVLERRETAAVPWWNRGSIVVTLAVLGAAVFPVTAAVQGSAETKRQIALAKTTQGQVVTDGRQKEISAVRSYYLETAKTSADQLRTLRFVLATTTEPALKVWAADEKVVVEKELKELSDALAAETAAAESAQAAYMAALKNRDNNEPVVDELKKKSDDATAKKWETLKKLGDVSNVPEPRPAKFLAPAVPG